jgi:hypothetical protein
VELPVGEAFVRGRMRSPKIDVSHHLDAFGFVDVREGLRLTENCKRIGVMNIGWSGKRLRDLDSLGIRLHSG